MILGITQSKKNTTMVEPFPGSSGMAIANQLSPPGEPMWKGPTKGGVVGFYIIVPTG
jgi:hypothetical protein